MIRYINEVYKLEVNRMHLLCAKHISLCDFTDFFWWFLLIYS